MRGCSNLLYCRIVLSVFSDILPLFAVVLRELRTSRPSSIGITAMTMVDMDSPWNDQCSALVVCFCFVFFC